jgi:hypothetical protein
MKFHPKLPDTEYLDPKTIEARDAALRQAIPSGWRGVLPVRPADVPLEKWRPDYSRLLHTVLDLHVTSVSNLDRWVENVRRRASLRTFDDVANIVSLLEDLVWAGANPWEIRHALGYAWWEARLQHELTSDRFRAPQAAPAGKALMSAAECSAWIAGRAGVRTSVFADPGKLDRSRSAFESLNPRGVLGMMGYETGEAALRKRITASHRCDSLKDVLCVDLRTMRASHDWWGLPGSESRARAIIRCIELFERLANARTHGDWNVAIEHWSSDREWLQAWIASLT